MFAPTPTHLPLFQFFCFRSHVFFHLRLTLVLLGHLLDAHLHTLNGLGAELVLLIGGGEVWEVSKLVVIANRHRCHVCVVVSVNTRSPFLLLEWEVALWSCITLPWFLMGFGEWWLLMAFVNAVVVECPWFHIGRNGEIRFHNFKIIYSFWIFKIKI